MSEREGQYFGARCWSDGHSVEETIRLAALEVDVERLPDNIEAWPKFVHGAEEGWQDKNLAMLDEKEQLAKMGAKIPQKKSA